MKKDLEIYNQKFKVFGRKKGRRSTNKLSISILKKYLLDISSDLINKNIILDIGSGDGQNSLYLSKKYSNYLIIASDIYQDGNINLSKQLQNQKINNVKIFDKNILILFEKIDLTSLVEEIWILYPDPWPKTKHLKRRLISPFFVEKISLLLKRKKRVKIATDCLSYFVYTLMVFKDSNLFRWVNDLPFEWDYNINNHQKTKYFKKSLRNNKKSLMLVFEKI